MIKKLSVIFACIILIGTIVGCTSNIRAKVYGGTANINLPPNTKFINATWKEANLWYVTRAMRTNEVAETYIFQESSSFGLVEGKVVFIESKQ